MNPIRRAFIMAFLINHGEIRRRDIQEAFGMSGRNATLDLTAFQELHGLLIRTEGRGQYYIMPPDYDTTVPLVHVAGAIAEITRAMNALAQKKAPPN